MYRVFLRTNVKEEHLIFDTSSNNSANPSDEYMFQSAKLSMEKNKTGSFEFTISKSHKFYDSFNLEVPYNTKFMTVVIYKKPNDDTDALTGVNASGVEEFVTDYANKKILGGIIPTYKWYWEGRVISVKTDFYKNKTILCEGCLGLLNDVVIQPGSRVYTNPNSATAPVENLLDDVLNIYQWRIREQDAKIIYYKLITENNDQYYQLAASRNESGSQRAISTTLSNSWANMKRIDVGTVSVPTTRKYQYSSTATDKSNPYRIDMSCSYTNLLEAIDSSLLSKLNGYLKFYRVDDGVDRYFKLDYVPDPIKDQEHAAGYIDFGVNLLDYTESYNIENIFTVCIPYGHSLSKDMTNAYFDPEHYARYDWWRWTSTIPEEQDQKATIVFEEADENHWRNNSAKRAEYTKDAIDTLNEFNKINHQKMGILGLQEPNDYGGPYLANYALVEKYGYIYKAIDLSSYIYKPENGSPSQLIILETALEYLRSYNMYDWELEVSGYDLSILDTDITELEIGMVIACRSNFHFAFETYLEVTKLELDLLNPANNKYSIGDSKKTGISDKVSKLEVRN